MVGTWNSLFNNLLVRMEVRGGVKLAVIRTVVLATANQDLASGQDDDSEMCRGHRVEIPYEYRACSVFPLRGLEVREVCEFPEEAVLVKVHGTLREGAVLVSVLVSVV